MTLTPEAKQKSDTPLTDALCKDALDSADTREWLKLASKLERQLFAVTAERDALRVDAERYRHGFESVISRLSHIHGLMWPEPFEADGKHFKFHPPEELVRETWEGLSKAIREIPAAIDAARAK